MREPIDMSRKRHPGVESANAIARRIVHKVTGAFGPNESEEQARIAAQATRTSKAMAEPPADYRVDDAKESTA